MILKVMPFDLWGKYEMEKLAFKVWGLLLRQLGGLPTGPEIIKIMPFRFHILI